MRVEHAQHLSRSAIARFGELGVIPSVQPAHLVERAPAGGRRGPAQRGVDGGQLLLHLPHVPLDHPNRPVT